jgi:hypothetical protein
VAAAKEKAKRSIVESAASALATVAVTGGGNGAVAAG